ncbi:uncharacterized protein LOC131308822 isoform X3 [Rhododendron vialii]|uniref:uncharacterized protein LOC131308822 isoform X3 n=1 Tax=Rhododendron vialii TaxID=182163 RepID=UPI00265DE0EE|nr:uncharacterized protein LOC131308822 isoform X3 [Rhododendron vialii]
MLSEDGGADPESDPSFASSSRYPTDLRCGCLQPNVRRDRRIKRALPAHRQDDKDYQVAAFELGHNDEMHHHLKNDRIVDALLS